MPFPGMLLGLLGAILVASWFISGENPIDQIGDALVELTTSEETRVSQLEPETQAKARQLVNDMMAIYGMRVRIGQTFRTPAQEKAVIAAGKSAVKTHSWHELARAFDAYPQVNGVDSTNVDDYRTMHEYAEGSLGLHGIAFNEDGTRRLITNAAGKKIWDGGHLEWRGSYATIAEAVAAEGSQYGIA